MSKGLDQLDTIACIIEIINTRLAIIGGFAKRIQHPSSVIIIQECKKCLEEIAAIRLNCEKEKEI